MAWTLIKQGEPNHNFSNYQEWQLDDADDMSNPPAEALNAAPSSKAWTGDMTHLWNFQNDGTWFDIMAGE